jgi:hypothetical protein
VGALWGGLSGGGVILLARPFWAFLGEGLLYWVLVGAYVGAPVGGFLSYFHIDDRKLEQSGSPHLERDAHWLEPFGYGAIVYMAIFHPNSLELSFYVVLVGALLGVFAAGSSHFSPDQWKESRGLLTLICVGMGSLTGAATGWLFRQFEPLLWCDPRMLGALAGSLTFFATFLRGRQLARRERA